jgi:hypothetical protein
MDAGGVAVVGAVAAVIGGLIGAGGAVAAAAVTGRSQLKTGVDQMQREARRAVYLRALATLNEASRTHGEVMEEFLRSLHGTSIENSIDTQTGQQWIDRCMHTIRSDEWRDIHALILLEGPPAVSSQSAECRDALREHNVLLLGYIARASGARAPWRLLGNHSTDPMEIDAEIVGAFDRYRLHLLNFIETARSGMYKTKKPPRDR